VSLAIWATLSVAALALLLLVDVQLDAWLTAGEARVNAWVDGVLEKAASGRHRRTVSGDGGGGGGGGGGSGSEDARPSMGRRQRSASPLLTGDGSMRRGGGAGSTPAGLHARAWRAVRRGPLRVVVIGCLWIVHTLVSSARAVDAWVRRRLVSQLNEIVSVGLVMGAMVGVAALCGLAVVRIGAEGHDAVVHVDQLVRRRAAEAAAAAARLHQDHLPVGWCVGSQVCLFVGTPTPGPCIGRSSDDC
jgi:hypothetical protein